ncbi:MAG: Lon protease [Herpetosiphonaceae bacterium]|nr:MAG: Lon protease [Herpetosiphonaceae bacterium]
MLEKNDPFFFDQNSDEQLIAGVEGEHEVPVVPLINTVLFPHMMTPLFVGRERSLAAVEDAMAGGRTIVAVAQRDPDVEQVEAEGLYTIGVEGVIGRVLKMPDGTTSILVQGQRRVRILSYTQEHPSLRARVVPVLVDEERTLAVEAMMRAVLSLFEKVVRLSRTMPDDAYVAAMNVDEPGWLADLIASMLPLDVARRQEILETIDPEERLRRLSIMLSQELEVLELESRIQSQVQQELDRSQREYFLREQLKAIQRELGQEDPLMRDIAVLRERIESAGLPENVQTKAAEELSRLEAMAPVSPEYAMVRTYLDWLLDLPWTQQSEDHTNLREAAQILDRNHYGLKKVKERILEFMAVRQLAGPRLKSPILCFVGPPGVGKTSLGRSIAEALGRRFVRLSLGGVHDEAEIRGHRRTYIGALPGRIIQTMKDAGTINPVFMLDEIDKLGADFRGDPAAALLEVLDPEQNNSFADHYLDLPYDLSKVMFITTANLLDTIPDPLLDRMEVIELPGYTEDEKVKIAQRFLIPRQLEANGLKPGSLTLSEDALRRIIRVYTWEAGVRSLEREIATICRKVARRVAEGRPVPRRILPSMLRRFLGPEQFTYGLAGEHDEVGVATGMVWTTNGGDIMAVEVTVMEGKGSLVLTGQLGEVMQESAQAALSYARANARRLGIEPRRFDKIDIHIHVPEGAVPKDGPSAGVTIASALISALTHRPLRRDVAMTGEITLRGRVLPIGGLKEKILGAHRAGITTVIIPKKNERDLEEIASHVRRRLTFVPVAHMDEVLGVAFRKSPLRDQYGGEPGAPAARPAETALESSIIARDL